MSWAQKKKAMMMRRPSRLPSGYRELAHITADGNAYFSIDKTVPIGYTVKSIVRRESAPTGSTTNVAVGGYAGGNFMAYAGFGTTANRVNTYYGTTSNYVTLEQLYGLATTVETTFNARSIVMTATNDSGTASNTVTRSSNIPDSTLLRIAYNGYSAAGNFVGDILGVEVVTGNGAPYITLVTCERLSDGKIGMYDMVSGEFHSSAGSSEFTGGPYV